MTASEYAKATGLSLSAARARLDRLAAQGLARKTPAYRFTGNRERRVVEYILAST